MSISHTRSASAAVGLEQAGDRLLNAFEDVRFDASMPRCTHCVTDEDMAALGGPVAELAPNLVARFVTKTGTTWGAADDLRRIAPRALMLAADRQLPLDRGVLWDKLVWAGWPDWTDEQVDAVHAYLLAEWERLLHSKPRSGEPAHHWLRVNAAACDIGPYLDVWHEAIGPLTRAPGRRSATVHLAGLLVNSHLRPDFPGTVGHLFDDDPVAVSRLTGWLTCTGTAHELRRAAEALENTSDARRVDLAVQRLRRFHAAVERSDVHVG